MSRRRHFGSVRQRASRKWEASYWHEGVRHLAPTMFTTRADALAYLSTVETKILHGGWVDPQAGKVFLSDYATTWLCNRPNLRPRTVEKYQYLLNSHILPTLGAARIADLSPSAVRAWHSRLVVEHPSTGAGAYRLLSSIYRTAVADELVTRSPCHITGGGTERAAERPTVSVAEVAALAEAMPERLRLLVLLGAWCGLRRGELLGLQRRDVDLLRGALRVERAVLHMLDGTMRFGPPKTEAGVRTVHFPQNIAGEVESHLTQYVSARPESWLFPSAIGGPLPAKTLQRAWNAARTAVGRPELHLHDLRHAGATWAAITGATTKELMARLGHSSPRAALIYQHATEDRDRALADALAGLAVSADVVQIKKSPIAKLG